MFEEIFNKSLDCLKQIPIARKNPNFDFANFDSVIFEFNDLESFTDKLNSIIDVELFNNILDNHEVIAKALLNYSHKQNPFLSYDIQIFANENLNNKKLLIYRKIFEIILNLFINSLIENTTVSAKHLDYLLNTINWIIYSDYLVLGYKTTLKYRINTKEGLKYFPEKSLKNEIQAYKRKIDSYIKTEKILTTEEINFLREIHKYWWEKYKSYIDEQYPALKSDLKFYNGVEIKICVTEAMTPNAFTDTGLAMCVGMLDRTDGNINIVIDNKIRALFFTEDQFNNFVNFNITWGFCFNDIDEGKSSAVSYMRSEVEEQLIMFFKSSLNKSGFLQFCQKFFEFSGFDFGEITSGGVFVSNSYDISENYSNIMLVDDNILNKDKIFYKISFKEKIDDNTILDIKKEIEPVFKYIYLTSSVLSSNRKKQFNELENCYFYDIDDIFEYAQKKISLHKNFSDIIFQQTIYPFLQTKIGSLKTNNPIIEAERLINLLNDCPRGKAGWKMFENITKEILIYLFEDSFNRFLIKEQCHNESGTDIRDFIIPNNGKHNFWNNLKQFYLCNNIVIESKNLSTHISNTEFRQISDYLEKETIGKFGIIFSRLGLSINGRKKQYEYLTNNPKKLILVLNDDNIVDLIRKKSNGENPEEFLQELKMDVEIKL